MPSTRIRHHHWLILSILFGIALFARIYRLGISPYSLHQDEAANTYLGRYVLENGTDMYGNRWPLFYIDKFGDYPPAIPMYLSGAATYLTEDNAYASRLPSAIIGAVFVAVLYVFILQFTSGLSAVAAGALAAVLPWHLALSRGASEGVLGLTVWLTGIFLLVRYITAKKPARLALTAACVSLAGTYLLYPAFRLMTPVTIIPFLAWPGAGTSKRRNTILVVAALIIFTAWMGSTVWGQGRFTQTSLFTNTTEQANIQNDTISQIYDHQDTPVVISRVFHNKLVGYGVRLVNLYLSYFNAQALFAKGGYPLRYQTPGVGLLYIFMIPLLLAGIMIRQTGPKERFLWWWTVSLLAVTPLASAITVDDSPNVHRGILLVVPYVILAALGVRGLYQRIRSIPWRGFVLGGFAVLVALEMIYTIHQMYWHMGVRYAHERNDGNSQMARYIADVKNEYANVLAPNFRWLDIYYLLLTSDYDPSYVGAFHEDLYIERVDNVQFLDDPCPTRYAFQHETTDVNTLYIDAEECDVQEGFVQIGDVLRRGGTTAFKMYTYVAPTEQ